MSVVCGLKQKIWEALFIPIMSINIILTIVAMASEKWFKIEISILGNDYDAYGSLLHPKDKTDS